MVNESEQVSVFSSKLFEWVLACISIVTLQHSGIMAVKASPVCALLKPRVSLTGDTFSGFVKARAAEYISHSDSSTTHSR